VSVPFILVNAGGYQISAHAPLWNSSDIRQNLVNFNAVAKILPNSHRACPRSRTVGARPRPCTSGAHPRPRAVGACPSLRAGGHPRPSHAPRMLVHVHVWHSILVLFHDQGGRSSSPLTMQLCWRVSEAGVEAGARRWPEVGKARTRDRGRWGQVDGGHGEEERKMRKRTKNKMLFAFTIQFFGISSSRVYLRQ
jgi:hypothetical protein